MYNYQRIIKYFNLAYWILLYIFLMVFYKMSSQAWDYSITIAFVNILLYIAISELMIELLIIPFFNKKKYILSLVIIFGTFLVNGSIILAGLWQTIKFTNGGANENSLWSQHILIYIIYFTSFAFLSFGIATRLIFHWFAAKQKVTLLENEKRKAELEFLKAQINPHSFFNYLNSIYALIDKTNPEARNAVAGFSEIMRYQLYDSVRSDIEIENEIAFLKSFIDVQKARKSDDLKVELVIDDSVKGFKVSPLLMMPFVENAFKHVKRVNGNAPFISIYLSKTVQKFIFKIINSAHENTVRPDSGGIGLLNVKRRLDLIFPERHILEIHSNAKQFIVQLEITIDETKLHYNR